MVVRSPEVPLHRDSLWTDHSSASRGVDTSLSLSGNQPLYADIARFVLSTPSFKTLYNLARNVCVVGSDLDSILFWTANGQPYLDGSDDFLAQFCQFSLSFGSASPPLLSPGIPLLHPLEG